MKIIKLSLSFMCLAITISCNSAASNEINTGISRCISIKTTARDQYDWKMISLQMSSYIENIKISSNNHHGIPVFIKNTSKENYKMVIDKN